MKVVLNALQYKQNSSGIGVMIRELFEAYSKKTNTPMQVILASDSPDFNAGEKTEVVRIEAEHGNGLSRMFAQTFRLGKDFCKDSVLIVTDSKTPLFLPKSCTLLPLITDMAVFRMPSVYQLSRVILWRLQYNYIRKKAKTYLTISEFSKKEIIELFKVSEDQVYVIPCACPAADKEAVRADSELNKSFELPERYILFVGNNNPRKNLRRILQAYDNAKGQGLAQHLVIAGEQGWKFNQDEAMAGIKNRESIHFIGYVPDELMPQLYSKAELFLFPTLYEGFGIPILEAQNYGVPVIASNITSHPEVAGNAAELVDPYDTESISRGILMVLTDQNYADELKLRGFENVNRFSWESSAEQMDKVINGVISNGVYRNL